MPAHGIQVARFIGRVRGMAIHVIASRRDPTSARFLAWRRWRARSHPMAGWPGGGPERRRASGPRLSPPGPTDPGEPRRHRSTRRGRSRWPALLRPRVRGEARSACWPSQPTGSLQRDVAVLAGGDLLPLSAQYPKGLDELGARLGRLDHVVHEAALGGDVGIPELILVLGDQLPALALRVGRLLDLLAEDHVDGALRAH